MPQTAAHIDTLFQLGIRLIVSLTEPEENFPAAVEERIAYYPAMRHVFIPMPDDTAPSMDQVQQFLQEVDACHADDHAAMVHCKHGHGRTGTFCLIWMMHAGLIQHHDAEKAVEEMRTLRPYSVSTVKPDQMNFITQYVADWEQIYGTQ